MVTAATLNWYVVLGVNSVIVKDNPEVNGIIRVNISSPSSLYSKSYRIRIPLGIIGGIHDNVTVVYVISITVSDLGADGSIKD